MMIIDLIKFPIAMLVALTINNIMWILKDDDFQFLKLMKWFKPNGIEIIKRGEKRTFKTISEYIFFYRIKTVWSNWIDLSSAVIGGLLALWWLL